MRFNFSTIKAEINRDFQKDFNDNIDKNIEEKYSHNRFDELNKSKQKGKNKVMGIHEIDYDISTI